MSREVHVPFYERLGVQFPRPTQRFALSFRDVEDLLAQRGITVTYETIRQWCLTFGLGYARTLRRRRGRLGDTWHLDELFVAINGRKQYLWRAVDEDGDVLDILVQSRRNRRAAVRFFRKLLKKQGCLPRRLVTDKLRSYPAAHRTVMPSVVHRTEQYANNRAEVSHQPTRQRERQMRLGVKAVSYVVASDVYRTTVVAHSELPVVQTKPESVSGSLWAWRFYDQLGDQMRGWRVNARSGDVSLDFVHRWPDSSEMVNRSYDVPVVRNFLTLATLPFPRVESSPRHCQVERSRTVLFPDCICPPRLSAGRRHRLPLDERSAAKQAVVS